MQSWKRSALAIAVILSGCLLIPFVALPRESFRWQMFADAYGNVPVMSAEPAVGGPGTDFLISGFGFPAGASLLLRANGVAFRAVTTDEEGRFSVWVGTEGAGEGLYQISADDPYTIKLAEVLASTSIRIDADAPVSERPVGTPGLTLPNLPAGLGNIKVYLPFVFR